MHSRLPEDSLPWASDSDSLSEMNRRLSVILLALAVSFAASAQSQKIPFFLRKAVESHNVEMRSRIDSLQSVIDSLRIREVDSLARGQEGNDPEPKRELVSHNYSAAEADSLLALWYENNFSLNPEPDVEFDLDSLRFSSDVPDSVMMSRLQAMNVPFNIPFNENVKNYMILYSEKMPSAMGRVLGLSNYYFPIFEEALLRYGLPLELKYMTVVESRLKPTALSRAGALGLWQFVYRTGKSYGLRIDSYVDERMDAEKSADAAARYLRDAYKILGDWPLAISSYNCGIGNVNKAILRAGGKRDYWSVHEYLPRETKRYVPAIIGAMYAMNYSREYGIQPADVGMPAMVDTFEIHKNLHFKQINEVVGVPMEDLKNLNPSYYQEIIPGNGGTCLLKLPYSWTSAFLAADQDSLYTHNADLYLSEKVIQHTERSSSGSSRGSGDRVSYKVKSGDTLSKIASRYHVSVKQVMKWNSLRSDRIRVGQTIYIYR